MAAYGGEGTAGWATAIGADPVMKILIPDHVPESERKLIRETAPDVDLLTLRATQRRSPLRAGLRWVLTRRMCPHGLYHRFRAAVALRAGYEMEIGDAPLVAPRGDVEAFLATWTITRELYQQIRPLLPGLRWVHSTMTGVDHLLPDEASPAPDSGLRVSCSKGVHSERIAEFAVTLIASVAKRLPDHARLQRRRAWRSLRSKELAGSIVAVVGAGSIGSAVARLARANGMRPIGIARHPRDAPAFEAVYGPDHLHAALARADFIVVCIPSTAETRGLIGAEALRAVRRDAYLVNVSRGSVVDEGALIAALDARRIAGAALDVFDDEPLPRNHPFYGREDVLVTHHSSYASAASEQEVFERFQRNVARYARGEPLEGAIDVRLGY